MSSFACEICNEDYNDHKNSPQFIDCCHTLCMSCILHIKKTVENKETFECPFCRMICDFHTIKKNFALLSNNNDINQVPKTNKINYQKSEESNFPCCDCSGKATKHCENCKANYCELCEKTNHFMYPHHKIRLIGEGTIIENPCSCSQNGVSLFCGNMECKHIESKSMCEKCFAIIHQNCSSIPISEANKMLNEQIELFLDKKLKESDKNVTMQNEVNRDSIRKQTDQRKKIETHYQKLREELEKNYQTSMRQLDQYIDLHRWDKTIIIEEEKKDISNKIDLINKIKDFHSDDLVSIYPKLFELFQSKSVVYSYFKDPKVQPNGLKWFPSYNIRITGNWQNGKTCFIDLLKKMSFGVIDAKGKCELYYGSTRLCFYFSADSSIESKYELHFTQFKNANPKFNCTVITITDKENQEDSYYLPLDIKQKPKAQQTIHQIIRDNFF